MWQCRGVSSTTLQVLTFWIQTLGSREQTDTETVQDVSGSVLAHDPGVLKYEQVFAISCKHALLPTSSPTVAKSYHLGRCEKTQLLHTAQNTAACSSEASEAKTGSSI